jgi:hypothetical protein
MSVASFAPDYVPPCVIIVDRSASLVEAIAGHLGDGSVRILGVRTALEAIRHVQQGPILSVLIGSPAGRPDGDTLARILASQFPSLTVDRLHLEAPIPSSQLD